MKKLIIIIFIFMFLTTTFYILSENSVFYNSTENITKISPFSQSSYYLYKLYFIDDDQLVSENRNVKIEKLNSEVSIINELKKGSKIENRIDTFNKDVQIVSIESSNRIVYVNLTSNFLDETDENLLYLKVMSIVNTFTEIESIDYVQILLDGKKSEHILFGEYLDKPIGRNLSMLKIKEFSNKDVVRNFMDNIIVSRYDIAYDLIDSSSKRNISFDNFKAEMTFLKEEIEGYTLRYMFTRREEGVYIVLVNYTLQNFDSNIHQISIDPLDSNERIYKWKISEEEGTLKIKYQDMD